jgi:hypothetical protein
MAYIRGSQIRPELGRTDYTPFLQGAMQGAQSIQRGVEQGLSSIERGIQAGRQQKETLRLEKEQQKLRNEQLTGMIETGTQQARAALLLYGQDPMIRTELENGLAFLSSANPAESKAVVAKGIGDTLNLLGQVGAVAMKERAAAAEVSGLLDTLDSMREQAEKNNLQSPALDALRPENMPAFGTEQERLTYLQSVFNVADVTLKQSLQAQQLTPVEKSGFDNEQAAYAAAMAMPNVKTVQVFQKDNKWSFNATFGAETEGEAASPIVPENLVNASTGQPVVFTWDSFAKKYIDRNTGLSREDMFVRDMLGEPSLNPVYRKKDAPQPDKSPTGGNTPKNENGKIVTRSGNTVTVTRN